MKYDREYKNAFQKAVYEKAEQFAGEIGAEGLRNATMTVEFEYDFFEFGVDCIVSNYEYEEDTNCATYNVEIFCFELPRHPSKTLTNFMQKEFYKEILYKD